VESASNHGYEETDILQALRNAMVVHDLDGYVMVVGPTTRGELIEVAVNRRDEIFHAMRARPRFL